MNLSYKVGLAGVLLSLTFSVNAAPGQAVEVAMQLNQSIESLVDVQGKVMALNEHDVVGQAIQFHIQAAKSDEALRAFGKAINYPSHLKQKYDQSARQVADIASRIVSWKSIDGVHPGCQEQLNKLSQPVSNMSKVVAESRRYNVVDDEQRAHAFMALSSSVGVTIVAAQVAMTAMASCSSVTL